MLHTPYRGDGPTSATEDSTPMHIAALVLMSLLGGGITEYSRALDAKALDQATLDAEGYGETKTFKREADGLRITLPAGDKETGWKTPQTMRIGGDYTIVVNVVVHKLPKPTQEDGAAFGIALASQNIDAPEVTFVREIEPNGSDVYRSIEGGANNPNAMMMMQQQQMMMMRRGMFVMPGGPGAAPAKPPRKTSPASGDVLRVEIRREGQVLRFQVVEGASGEPRYLGQMTVQPMDLVAVKLFASNRNGAGPVDVTLKDFSVRADRITGLGTSVRTVFGQVVYADPTAIDGGILTVGGTPKPPSETKVPAALPANVFASPPGTAPKPAPSGATTPNAAVPAGAATPAPAAAAVAVAPARAVAVVAAAPARAVRVVRVQGGATVTMSAVAPQQAAMVVQQPGAAPGGPAKPAEPRKMPLDEIESIRFERTPVMIGRYLGQPNLDFTMTAPAPKPPDAEAKDKDKEKEKDKAKEPEKKKEVPKADDVLAPPPGTAAAAARVPKLEPKKNGIRDLLLTLSNLREAEIKQITITTQTDKGPASWRLDTSDSQDSPLVLRRSGHSTSADIFLDPPAGDLHQKDLMVMIMYADNQNANLNVKVTEHTDAKLAVDPKAPANPFYDARVVLTNDETLTGKFDGMGEETLKLTTPWQDHLEIPLTRVVGLQLGVPDRKETPESFDRRLATRGSEDTLLARTKDGEVVAITGAVEGTDGDKMKFRYRDKTRTLPLAQVEGLILAARPEAKPSATLSPVFSISGGSVVSGKWKEIDSANWKIETPWGQTLSVPAADVQGVRLQGGKVTYLSDLNPSKVEETPFFGRKLGWRKDVNLVGEPLKLDGRPYDRGLSVHSRSALTYDLNGKFATFEALVGFDESARGKGRVDCRVYADGKEIYANADLRADGPPVSLKLPVSGAEQLKLVVDFGRDQDTGDRVIWANARLYRPTSTTVGEAASGTPKTPGGGG